MKDWIDEGTLTVYYLGDSNVAQSGCSCSGHPIVGVVLEDQQR